VKKYDRRIVVVTRETRLEKVLMSQNTRGQARFYIKSLGGDFDDYDEEDRQYHVSLQEARQNMEGLGNLQILDRKYLPNFIFAPDDLVVVIGQDGLVANTIKYLDGQPVIGVNPDTSRWDGVLLPFAPKDVAKILRETLAGRRRIEEISMARAHLQNGQELLAVNDFFIGQRTHVSARYVIKQGGLKEPQSSSGVIVSTGLGSTGWMKSVIAGAARISTSVIGHPYGARQEQEDLMEADEELAADEPACAALKQEGGSLALAAETPAPVASAPPSLAVSAFIRSPVFPKRTSRREKKTYGVSELSSVIGKWGSRELVFAVREPFPSKTTGTNLVFGKISADMPLRIESLMGENGVIFSDGMESDFLVFNFGAEAVIGLADKRGHVVM
jgi:NAD kinase